MVHQLHDAEGQGVDDHVQTDGGPDGIGLFVGPAQGDAGGEIGDGRQQHGLGVIEQKILPDVEKGEEENGHHVGGDAAAAADDAEDQPPDQGLLDDGGEDDRAKCHDPEIVGGQGQNGVVVIAGHFDAQQVQDQVEQVISGVVEGEAQNHRLDQLPEPGHAQAPQQEIVEDQPDHQHIDGEEAEIELQLRQPESQQRRAVGQQNGQQHRVKGQVAEPRHPFRGGKPRPQGRRFGICHGKPPFCDKRRQIAPGSKASP